MQKICILFCTVTSIFILTATFPLGEKELDELIHNLQDVRNQYEMEHFSRDGQERTRNASSRNSAKPSLDSDTKSLLYDYYANTMAPVYSKRSFMPVHGKRTSQPAFKEIEPIQPVESVEPSPPNKDQKMIYGSYSKGNFNEADQYGFDNFYKRNFEDFGTYN